MDAIIILLAIAAVPLLMWLMVMQRRRVNAKLRAAREEEPEVPVQTAPFEDVQAGRDGLSYGRRSDPSEEQLPVPDTTGGEVHGIRGLQGRR